MVVEASDNPKFYDDDDDDGPTSGSCSGSSSSSSNCNDSVKKRFTTLPVKRPLDDSNSLHISCKQSKLSLYDDDDEEEEDNDDDNIPISRRIKRSDISADTSFSVIKKFVKKELALFEKSFEECHRKRGVEEQRLQSLKRDIEECSKELRNKKTQVSCVRRINQVHQKMQGKIEECVKDLVAKEAQLYLMEDLIEERKLELKTKEIELRQVMENIDEDRERKEEELRALSIKFNAMNDFESMKKQFEGQVKELVLKERQLEEQVKEFQSKEEEFEGQIKELESEKEHFESRMKELESKEKQFEGQAKELESKEKQLEGRLKAFQSKKEEFEGQMKELEFESKEKQLEGRLKAFQSKKEEFEGQMKELESQKKHFKSRVKELESKKKQLEGRLKKFESKEKELESQVKRLKSKKICFKSRIKKFKSKKKRFKSRVKELESKEKQFEGQVMKLKSKEKQIEDQVKEFQSREEEFEGRVKELESKKKHFESRMEDFKSKEKQFERRGKERESIENRFDVQSKELSSKEKQFEGQLTDLESELNKFDGPLKDLELREKPLINSFGEVKESGGKSLQFLPSDQTDELESFGNDILVNLLASSDPPKVVLDIIQNPVIPQCKEGDNGIIIDDGHIILLEQLMRISPAIKPHVREEAMKLALDLKAYISENTENSLAVLGFLFLLSIYGLVPSFDEDEVFKLFGFVAQHRVAVELFGTLGFADKISDLVQNLIGKQQYIEAVRFICAYHLVDKYQIVELL